MIVPPAGEVLCWIPEGGCEPKWLSPFEDDGASIGAKVKFPLCAAGDLQTAGRSLNLGV